MTPGDTSMVTRAVVEQQMNGGGARGAVRREGQPAFRIPVIHSIHVFAPDLSVA